MPKPRVYADFQNADPQGRLRLICAGTVEDLARQQIVLQEGLSLCLYEPDTDSDGQPDELLADGTVTYSRDEHCWVAVIDWKKIEHASKLASAPEPTRKAV